MDWELERAPIWTRGVAVSINGVLTSHQNALTDGLFRMFRRYKREKNRLEGEGGDGVIDYHIHFTFQREHYINSVHRMSGLDGS